MWCASVAALYITCQEYPNFSPDFVLRGKWVIIASMKMIVLVLTLSGSGLLYLPCCGASTLA